MSLSPAASRRLVALAQGVALAALLARLVSPPSPIVSCATVALCAALLGAAAFAAATHSSAPRRTLCLALAGACATAVLSEIALIADIAGGGPTGFLAPSRVIYLFGTHSALLVGFVAALGFGTLRLRLEVALDALLLVAAAAIVQLLLPYGASDLAALPGVAEKAAYIYRQGVTAAELGLVALLVATRGEALGLRLGISTLVGTVAFAVANAARSHDATLPGAAAATSGDVPWLLCVLVFTMALRTTAPAAASDEIGGVDDAEPRPREDTGRHAAVRHRAEAALLHGGTLVVAIIICAASALVLGFSVEPRPALGIGVAVFGVLGAARFAYVLFGQRREAAALASSVVAEREASAALEARVAERTAELAEAQRVLQRMWVLGHQVTLELHPARVLRRFVEAVADVAQADGAAVGLLVGESEVRVAAAVGMMASMEAQSLPVDGSALGRVVRTRRTWCCADVDADAESAAGLYAPWQERLRAIGDGVRAIVVVPLQRRGETIGAISLLSRHPRHFTPADLERIESLTDMLSVALANAELVENIRQAEWRFRTLFRAAPDAVLTVLQSGRVREANDCVRDLLGLDPVRVVGRRFADMVRAEDRERLEASLRDALAGRPTRLEVRCLRRTAPGGDDEGAVEERVVALAASRLPESDSPTVLVIGRDITTEREMRARLLETERLAAVGELVAGVAHEVNNPLSSISAFAQLLLRAGGLTADQRESLEVIRAETMRASQVVKDLLAFARRSEPRRETLDLNALVARTLRLRNYQLASSNLHVEVALPPDLPPVVGDARQLQQVVLNLVTNSIQAMAPAGAGTLRVTTRAAALRSSAKGGGGGGVPQVELEVADTGPGIPPAARAHVFEPFFTTKPEGEGTGLGLSVSYGIVTAHGGTIQIAESTPRGTRIVVSLPAAAAAVPTPRDAERIELTGRTERTARIELGERSDVVVPASPAPIWRSPLAGMRLLFIDDEPALRSGMEAFGRQRGFTVVTAGEGSAGLAAVERTAFDAIVCDLRMPGMSGLAFHEALARERPGLARRTVFITGDVVASVGAATPTGHQPTVAKPFTFERLEEALVAVMKGS